jgi:hypothetical protein
MSTKLFELRRKDRVSEKQKFFRLCLTLFISNNIKMLG